MAQFGSIVQDLTVEEIADLWAARHASVQHFATVLRPNPNLPEELRDISEAFWILAISLLEQLKDGPELSTALRKLREAKDCAVMQAVLDRG